MTKPVTPPPASEPKRYHGIWRVVSLLAAASAIVLCVVVVLQARSASNVGAVERPRVELEQATVAIAAGLLQDGSEVSVLGLDQSDSRISAATETEIDVPRSLPAVVALYAPDGALVGLSLVKAGQDRSTIELDATTTARALIVLSPGVLRPDLASSLANVAGVEGDESFAKLVAAIEANPNLSVPNDPVEIAFAEISDRVPLTPAPADQGCDSVLSSRAYAEAGACIEPADGERSIITNEQDRWALLFGGLAIYNDVCAVLGPAQSAGQEIIATVEQCGPNVLLVAPGPLRDVAVERSIVEQRVRTATGFNILHSHTGPFADLVAGSASHNRNAAFHLTNNTDAIVTAISSLIETNAQFAAAMDIYTTPASPDERMRAVSTASRLLIEASDTTSLVPERSSVGDQHIAVLDFYERASDHMAVNRPERRWDAEAAGLVDIGMSS